MSDFDPQDLASAPPKPAAPAVKSDFDAADVHPNSAAMLAGPPAGSAAPEAGPGIGQAPQPGFLSSLASGLANALDVTGPLRSGIGEYQRSGSLSDALDATSRVLNDDKGAEPAPPSWKDIIAKTGVLSAAPTINTGLKLNPWSKDPQTNSLHISPAGIAGAAVGAATDPLTYLGGPAEDIIKGVPEGLAEGLDSIAAQKAIRQATGNSVTAVKRAAGVKSGTAARLTPAFDNLESTGNALLAHDEADSAIKAVAPGDSGIALSPDPVTTAINSGLKRQFFGDKIGQVQQAIDATTPKAVNGQDIANAIVDYAGKLSHSPQDEELAGKLLNHAAVAEKKGDMSFAQAQAYKNSYVYTPGKNGDAHIDNADAMNHINQIISGEMEKTADKLAPQLPQDLAGNYEYYKQKYKAYLDAEQASTQNALGVIGRNYASPSDKGMGGIAGLAAIARGHSEPASLITGVLAGAANKAVRANFNYVAARGASGAANALRSVAPAAGAAARIGAPATAAVNQSAQNPWLSMTPQGP